MISLLAGLLVLASPTAQGEESPLRTLMTLLQDDSVEVREEAAAKIVALGESALPDLKEALLKTSNGEVRGRLRGAIGRIEAGKRRRDFKGGSPVNGLGAILEGSLDKATDEFLLRVQIVNLGDEPRALVLIQGWNRRLPCRSESSSSAEAGVVIKQLTGERSNRFSGSFSCCSHEPSRTVVLLMPGEGRTFERRVSLKDLRAGDHQVQVEYYSGKLLRGSAEDLKSNTIDLKIEASGDR